ncbi:hypothetical protein [Sulfurirhabdus autotrophica]|uniref:Uncharacterized protein n=1 Tax=Sulfurirhabdus autotrophica TaxID=1706046 RepID=A0A4R3XRW9_9PROT|nr:hypothetical protein [Sulfurirhabdus autotrophica]TCV82365.1 hypothetical protein EDC63_12257 [Sulfurirhabdus autotrophica]
MFLLFPFLLLGYLLLGLAVSRAGTRWAGRRFQSRLVPWVVFVVLFTVFFGDEIYGYWHWQYLCRSEGGLHVYKSVPVEGFFINDNSVGVGTAREYLKPIYGERSGLYKFVEGRNDGHLHRYSAGSKGEFDIQDEVIDKPSVLYAMSEQSIVSRPNYIWSVERSIYNMTNQERMGIARSFGYQGSTIIRFLRVITGANKEGSANYCGDTRGFIEAVIPPIQ